MIPKEVTIFLLKNGDLFYLYQEYIQKMRKVRKTKNFFKSDLSSINTDDLFRIKSKFFEVISFLNSKVFEVFNGFVKESIPNVKFYKEKVEEELENRGVFIRPNSRKSNPSKRDLRRLAAKRFRGQGKSKNR